MSNKVDHFNIKVNGILNEMKVLQEQNTKLLGAHEKLTNEVHILKTKVDDIEQKTLEKAVEIVGIPTNTNEDYKSLVKEITHKLNIECDIVKAYYLRLCYGLLLTVIIHDKNHFISEARKMKYNANQYKENWRQLRIYINNHLTKVK